LSIAFDSRPSRSEIEPVALDLIRRRGAEVLGTARYYACSPEDAEDAYQRALEILLTKAPTTDEAELLPWLKVVVKHEAYALRQKRERCVPAEHRALEAFAGGDGTTSDDRAERYDRLRVGAEALRRLKPQEMKALLLKAEGLSYREIADELDWSYTKVNRCLTEGRRAFLARVEGIDSGAECERLAPLLSALADGEATAEDMAALRPHLRGCPACRATLRDYREAPGRVAALAAPAGLFAWLGERIGSLWAGLRSLADVAVAHKAAAVAASTVVVAGGGAATVHQIERSPERPPERTTVVAPKRAPAPAAPVAQPAAVQAAGSSAARTKRRSAPQRSKPTPPPAATPSQVQPRPTPSKPKPRPTSKRERPRAPAGEFGP
jgi:RNA polymerase sigma factor (sigma-70 family)